ncbi:hypothetical protein SO802_008189 [Lithocarpus litseifolius]|uniref:Uncharacterized protein n=1 Tax=Lithocarpus litseifolius TaxID=425828 RepID=A0AAW2D8G3_9ROSI
MSSPSPRKNISSDKLNTDQASQMGEIGITVQSLWYVPKYQTVASTKAALRALDFMLGCF